MLSDYWLFSVSFLGNGFCWRVWGKNLVSPRCSIISLCFDAFLPKHPAPVAKRGPPPSNEQKNGSKKGTKKTIKDNAKNSVRNNQNDTKQIIMAALLFLDPQKIIPARDFHSVDTCGHCVWGKKSSVGNRPAAQEDILRQPNPFSHGHVLRGHDHPREAFDGPAGSFGGFLCSFRGEKKEREARVSSYFGDISGGIFESPTKKMRHWQT